jgi:uncharacterized membrane protein
MYKYLEYLKNPFISGLMIAILIVILAVIDQKINDRDFDNGYYIRLFIGVFILVAGLIYFISNGQTKSNNMGVNIKKIGGNMNTIKSGIDVYSDIPDF